jgi:hypothetical protein
MKDLPVYRTFTCSADYVGRRVSKEDTLERVAATEEHCGRHREYRTTFDVVLSPRL